MQRPHSEGTEPTCPSREGVAAPTARPRSVVSPRRPRLREAAPAAPRPLRGPATRLFPARGPRRPTTPSRTRTAEPAADSRVRGSPAQRRPRSASPATHRRREGAARTRGGGRGAPHSLRDPTPDAEPTEPRRLGLQGLSPARTLDKHFRASGGGQGLAPELLAGWSCQPSREGRGLRARRQRTRPPGSLLTPVVPQAPGYCSTPLF